jgi:AcrR family transcriptional regulator
VTPKSSSQTIKPPRQAAYTARNRAAILKAAQHVLADIGPSATIEQIVGYAQVSPTTIYKYFSNREVLLAEALADIWDEWVAVNESNRTTKDDLEDFIDTARKFFRLNASNPTFGKILKNTLGNPEFVIQSVSGPARIALKTVAENGALEIENFETRLYLFSYALAGIATAVYVSETMTPKQADEALVLAVELFNVDADSARKIIAKKL